MGSNLHRSQLSLASRTNISIWYKISRISHKSDQFSERSAITNSSTGSLTNVSSHDSVHSADLEKHEIAQTESDPTTASSR